VAAGPVAATWARWLFCGGRNLGAVAVMATNLGRALSCERNHQPGWGGCH